MASKAPLLIAAFLFALGLYGLIGTLRPAEAPELPDASSLLVQAPQALPPSFAPEQPLVAVEEAQPTTAVSEQPTAAASTPATPSARPRAVASIVTPDPPAAPPPEATVEETVPDPRLSAIAAAIASDGAEPVPQPLGGEPVRAGQIAADGGDDSAPATEPTPAATATVAAE